MLELWLRRLHMYAALFLCPWVLMYAISAAVMNHGEHFGGPPPEPLFAPVFARPYAGTLPEAATPAQIATQILDELGMPGRFRAHRAAESDAVVIIREAPLGLHRITYRPADRLLTLESGRYGPRRALAQLHRRCGFGSGFLKEEAWAGTVDAFVAAMLLWIVSGLWMWWRIGKTRQLGWIACGSGLVLFLFFLLSI